jgi:hypothetical protein
MSDIDKSNASYWTHKAIQTGDKARVQKNRNTIEGIANSQKIRELEKENDFYKRLLKRSSAVIALNSEDFKKTYTAEQAEAIFYKNLLSKPMAEIAEHDKNFKEMFDKQQEMLATWMINQRAMKEVAMILGKELGKTEDEVIKLAKQATKDVLNGETKHGNNAEDMKFVKPYIEKIKSKI